MSIESELIAIKGKKELLTAEEVVAWASKHPKSKLHKQFEWDDGKAAQEYRLWQARRVIAIGLVYPDGTRKFYSLSVDRSNVGGGFRDVGDILKSKDLHDVLLADALREFDRIRQRYEVLKTLKPVWSAVERVRKSKRQKGEEERPAA